MLIAEEVFDVITVQKAEVAMSGDVCFVENSKNFKTRTANTSTFMVPRFRVDVNCVSPLQSPYWLAIRVGRRQSTDRLDTASQFRRPHYRLSD